MCAHHTSPRLFAPKVVDGEWSGSHLTCFPHGADHTSPTMRTSEVQPLQELEELEESEVERDFERGSLSSRDALN